MNEKPEMEAPKKRPLGIDRGKVILGENFDDPLPEFEEAFNGMSENDPLYRPPLDEPPKGD